MRILLVEDDPALGPAIARALRAEQCAVDLFDRGVDAGHAGDTEIYDAAVLDLGLPDGDGMTLLRQWREAGAPCPC